MSDNRPRPPDRKFALVAPFAIGLAAVVVLVVLLLKPTPGAKAPPAPEPPPVAETAPPLVAAAPVASAPLGRAELIAGARAAAAAYAAGELAESKGLAGRTFLVRLAFGCGGPLVDPGATQAYYQRDAAAGTVRLVARPAVLTDLPLIRAAPLPPKTEAVEGFWLPRPWLTAEGCPKRRPVAPPATPTPVEAPSLGLVVFHDEESPRAARRGDRPYEVVIKSPTSDGGAATNFVLVIEGRLTGFADGAAVHCWSESAEHRPICLFGAALDRVAFEDDKGATLAQWPT
ncbi:MAG: hypothetical protein AB1542_17450 [Pseudomonadota bacterium]|jgi:hypothetical protein|uniref:hypothetical protein n=1 Tax=Caulobacter sp. CCH9-E1 TaxID=1768768 RepID=UPI000830695D|nr:hypothetical protein [Caulobacter sp. CCH9-E1]